MRKGGPGLMHGRGDHARVGWFARYWRPSDGCPAQPIMVESEHPLDDPRGAGGMGTVYLAESPAGARVAIKVIRPELAGDVAFLDRFRREVGAARRVAGFCTAQVLDANLDGTAPYR